MKLLKFLVSLASCLALPAAAETIHPSAVAVEWYTQPAPAGAVAPNDYLAQVNLTFPAPASVTSWGAPVRAGSFVNITIAASTASNVAGAAGSATASHLYDLGVLPLGNYTLRIYSGSVLAKSVAFTSAAYPPTLPATATVTVNPADPANVTATVSLQFTQVVQMRPQPAVLQDSTGRYLLEAIFDRMPANAALGVPPPPFTLTYSLGAVPSGSRVAVFKLNGQTLAEKPFTVAAAPPPPPAMDVAVTLTKNVTNTGISIAARLEFKDSAWVLANPGVPARIGNTFDINAAAETPAVLPAVTPRVYEPNYPLGLLPDGAYHVNYRINGVKKAELDFTVVVTPPPAPVSLASFRVRADGTVQIADLGLTIGSPATTITDWGTAAKDGATFTANITTATSTDPVPQVIRTETHSYSLGTLDAGSYTFIVKIDGHEIGRPVFAIPTPPPPTEPRFAYLKPQQTSAGYRLEAGIFLPNGVIVTDWGTMSRAENRFTATVTFGAGPLPPGAVVEAANVGGVVGTIARHFYELGGLTRGAYSAALLKSDGSVFGSIQFSVADTPPPPPPPTGVTLQRIEVFNDAASVKSLVAVNIPDPAATVLDWGTATVSGNVVTFALTIGPRVTPLANGANAAGDPAVIGPHLELHTYDLGSLAAGAYRFIVSANGTEIGRREITVNAPPPPPPPPPPPVPNVAYVKFGAAGTDRTAEVGILLPTPDLEVTDWGSVTADGRKLRVCITVAAAGDPPIIVDPLDPPPVVPVDPADPGVVALNSLAANSAAGAAPVRLAVHTYNFGALAAGEYAFTVCINGKDAVTRPFMVETTTTGVFGSLQPSNLETAKTGPHVIHLLFRSSAGMETAAGAKVTVTGPRDFTATATFKSEGILSMDPLGMILGADFEVSTADGSWDAADSGVYRVTVDPTTVKDKAGNPLRNANIGSFVVRIWPTPPPTPQPVVVQVAQAAGIWQATVTITTPSTQAPWKVASAKPVLANGPVLNLSAELVPGIAGTDPAQISLTFDLGSLAPGRYLAVFKSNAGHCGSTPFTVAGEELPTPMDGWAQIALPFGDPAANADPDGDGQPNLAEYCLGTDPLRPDAPQFHPSIERDAQGQPHLVILFRRVTGATDVSTIVEVSRDLKTWQPAGTDVDITIRSTDIDGTELVCACQKAVLGQPGSWPFMRVRLEKAIPAPQ